MAKRYAPAQQTNCIMYLPVKFLWLRSPKASLYCPEKASILMVYDRIKNQVLVNDPIL